MSEKRPIEPEDIKAGDRIRFEYAKPIPGHADVYEYMATRDGHRWASTGQRGQHYLLEGPKTLLYPAGTDLWLTEDHYPWKAGHKITLAEDWYEGADGHAGDGMYVGLGSVTAERPERAVDVPDTPTLGWLKWDQDGVPLQKLAFWERTIFGVFAAWETSSSVISVPLGKVTAFVPATAVPTEALDELRRSRDRLHFADTPATRRIDAFLAAIDEATS